MDSFHFSNFFFVVGISLIISRVPIADLFDDFLILRSIPLFILLSLAIVGAMRAIQGYRQTQMKSKLLKGFLTQCRVPIVVGVLIGIVEMALAAYVLKVYTFKSDEAIYLLFASPFITVSVLALFVLDMKLIALTWIPSIVVMFLWPVLVFSWVYSIGKPYLPHLSWVPTSVELWVWFHRWWQCRSFLFLG